MSRKIFSFFLFVAFMFELILLLFFLVEQSRINVATTSINKLYKDTEMRIPKVGINRKQIEKVRDITDKIYLQKNKKKLLENIDKLYDFQEAKDLLFSCFSGDNILPNIEEETINQLNFKMTRLNNKQKQPLLEKYNTLKKQYSDIIEAKSELNNLFVDSNFKNVKENISREEKNQVYKKLQDLPQKEILIQNQQYLDAAEKYILDREEKERLAEIKRKQEAARQAELARQYAIRKAQEEAIKKAEEEKRIQEAYVEINNVPYINQRINQVYNGCEAASLLMALQHKGYASDYNLVRMAEEMPKHENDPHKGFIYSIFDMTPNDVTHWIAPDALANFGSEFAKTTNVSGISANEITQYIDNDIPVIIYATYGFMNATKWIGEVPLNLHVMLVVGYNRITGAYVINDPWAGKIIVKKENFEKIYNIKKYAVVVE